MKQQIRITWPRLFVSIVHLNPQLICDSGPPKITAQKQIVRKKMHSLNIFGARFFCAAYHSAEFTTIWRHVLKRYSFSGLNAFYANHPLQKDGFSKACSLWIFPGPSFLVRLVVSYSQKLWGIATKIPHLFSSHETWVMSVVKNLIEKKVSTMLSFIIFNVFQITFQLSHWKQSQPPILSERTCRSYQALVDAKSVPYCKTIWTELEVKNMTGVIAGQSHLIIIEMAFSARNKNVSEKTAQQTKTHWFH